MPTGIRRCPIASESVSGLFWRELSWAVWAPFSGVRVHSVHRRYPLGPSCQGALRDEALLPSLVTVASARSRHTSSISLCMKNIWGL